MNINVEIQYSNGDTKMYPTDESRTVSHLMQYASQQAPAEATSFVVVIFGETGNKARTFQKAVRRK